MCDGLGAELFKFRPLDKDDALPMVRKACAGERRMAARRAARVGTQYNGPMSPTRTDVKRGPNSHRPPPAGTPHPSPHSFDRLGPPFCGRVQSLCDGLGAEALQISAPSISAPSIKDDATHGEESGGEGNARAAQSVQSTTADEPDQNRCEERAQFSSTAPGRNPHPSPHSFDRLGHICTYIAGSLLLAYEVSAHTHIHPSTWHTSSQCWPRSW
jgi:hypothetical protein